MITFVPTIRYVCEYPFDGLRGESNEVWILANCRSRATLISGCMRHDIQMYESVDHSEKSVTVPAGSSGLKGE